MAFENMKRMDWWLGLLAKPNFMSWHYIYIIGWAIVGSVIIYPAKNMAYIDCLFFASGSATQAGLNPIDTNTLKIYQQLFLYLIPMFTNPIIINTAVVLVRRRGFIRHLEHVVALSRHPSRARTMSMANTRDEEGRMRGRAITMRSDENTFVDFNEQQRNLEGIGGGTLVPHHSNTSEKGMRPEHHSDTSSQSSRRSLSPGASSSTAAEPSPTIRSEMPSEVPQTAQSNQNVQFVNLPSPPHRDGGEDASQQHIAFVERQRQAPQVERALRIPGPREFEKGERVHEVDDDDAITVDAGRPSVGGRLNSIATQGRSYSMSKTLSNTSLRLRKAPTMDVVGKNAQNLIENFFTLGPKRRPSVISRKTTKEAPPMPYLSYQPTVGRNSQFVDLTDEEMDELGGIEFRALTILLAILIFYFVFFQILGFLILVPWINSTKNYADYVRSVGTNPTWWGFFTAATAFNDVGFTLTPDSMVSFQKAAGVLALMTFLIIIGNTGFPCMLRFMIWSLFKLLPSQSRLREPLNFLLDHPRRCFTLLFPKGETWMLFAVLFGLNVLDVILFMALDRNNEVVKDIPTGPRVMVAIFQAASTRTSGTSAVNLAALHPAVQVSYLVMMYISVFPIAMSVRRTNVYEEGSLGIYDDGEDEDPAQKSLLSVHLRKQLSFDLPYVFLGLFLICCSEGTRLSNTNEYAFTIFSVLFEIVSAYGTVGLSLGYPTNNAAFSGQFNTFSKLVIIAMQIRGRHRGLPYAVDRAIMLPKQQSRHDAEIATLASRGRRGSSISRRASMVSMPLPTAGTRSFSQRVPSQAIEEDP